MIFNKQETILEKAKNLFRKAINEKASFKKIAISGRNKDGLDMLFNTDTVSTKLTITSSTDDNGLLNTESLFNGLIRHIRNEN